MKQHLKQRNKMLAGSLRRKSCLGQCSLTSIMVPMGMWMRPLPWEAGQGRGRGVTEAELRSPHVPDSVSSWCEGGSSVGDCPLFDRGVVRGRDQRVLVQPGQAAHMVKPVRIWGERGGGF